MTITNFQTQLLTLMLSLTLSSFVMAGDTIQNENKYNRASNTFSDADYIDHTGSGTHPALDSIRHVKLLADVASHDETPSAEELYEQQRETLRRFLEERHRRMYPSADEPADAEARRKQFINDIEQRRKLIDKMYEYRRKAIEERRQERLIEMNRTAIDQPSISGS